jgi:hypothetical protein
MICKKNFSVLLYIIGLISFFLIGCSSTDIEKNNIVSQTSDKTTDNSVNDELQTYILRLTGKIVYNSDSTKAIPDATIKIKLTPKSETLRPIGGEISPKKGAFQFTGLHADNYDICISRQITGDKFEVLRCQGLLINRLSSFVKIIIPDDKLELSTQGDQTDKTQPMFIGPTIIIVK